MDLSRFLNWLRTSLKRATAGLDVKLLVDGSLDVLEEAVAINEFLDGTASFLVNLEFVVEDNASLQEKLADAVTVVDANEETADLLGDVSPELVGVNLNEVLFALLLLL